jgi:type II secretory pathway pseudopilin PulG
MKKLKAYTLMEMLVVMTIMIILLSVGFTAYASFTETTKYNQDVADLEQDIIIIQRAAMLLERDSDEDWIYGLGIDFSGLRGDASARTGEYTFFKWCSEVSEFGAPRTRARYPRYIEGDSSINGIMPTVVSGTSTKCDAGLNELVPLTGYGTGDLSLQEDVSISSDIRFLLFESVSGRAFLYDTGGNLLNPNVDLEIHFSKNFGDAKVLQIENLTGRTKVYTPTP